MPLITRSNEEAERRVKEARYLVDAALIKMGCVLSEVQDQVQRAKEELSARESHRGNPRRAT